MSIPLQNPIFDLLFLDTHDSKYVSVADVSFYPTGFNKTNPSIEITMPGFAVKVLAFTPSSIQVYNSNTLGITCDGCDFIPLPDGIWTVRYSVSPSFEYYIQKTFLRVDSLYQRFDAVYMKMDFMQCNDAIRLEDRRILESIETFIEGAIAAANKCANSLAMDLYVKASQMIDGFVHNRPYLNNNRNGKLQPYCVQAVP